MAAFAGREVVVTEKLDGENTTLYRDGLHARSLDSGHHPSRAWVKAMHGRIATAIPAGWRVCGENLFARHSLAYTDLDCYFYAFSTWAGDRCLPWDDTVRITRRLGLPVPPVLWRGAFDERALRALRLDLTRQEGYVVRTAAGFDRAGFADHVAKWVRAGHVRTGTHWMHAPVVPNGLGRGAPLWAVRGGAPADPAALADAVGADVEPAAGPIADAEARLDVLGRTGDARLAGVLAVLLHPRRRPWRTPIALLPTGTAGTAGAVTVLTPTAPVRSCTTQVGPGMRDLLTEDLFTAWEQARAGAFAVTPPPLHRRHAAWAVITVTAADPVAFEALAGRVRGRMRSLLTALEDAGVVDAHAWPRPFAAGAASARYAVGLGRTPPDAPALNDVTGPWLAGQPGVVIGRVPGGEVPDPA